MSSERRIATINRDTNETKIQASLSLDGGPLEAFESDAQTNGEAKNHATQNSKSQTIEIDTGIGFLDHMLHALAKHAGWSLRVRSRGDLFSTTTTFLIKNLLKSL
jgi:imidazoleglycerol-phosphate dehydratase